MARVDAADVSTPAACITAKNLIASGLPERALPLVTGAHGSVADPCFVAEANRAKTAIDTAGNLIAAAQTADTSNRNAEARRLLDQALRINSESVQARELDRLLKEKAADEKTGLEVLSDGWKTFVTGFLKPAQDLALPFLYVLAALLILARSFALLPIDWPRVRTTPKKFKAQPEKRRISPRERRTAWVIGLLLAIAASLAMTIGAAERGALGHLWTATVLTVGVILAVAAIVFVGFAVAIRLRLNIEVRGSKGDIDQAATGQVVALLTELGAAPPSSSVNLEVPRGADVTILDGTPISGTPEGKFVGAIARLWKLTLGSTPWQVRVDVEDKDAQTVAISRNGHTIASAVIDRDLLGLQTLINDGTEKSPSKKGDTDGDEPAGDRRPDLHRFAAAVVLTTLADCYTGFEGLCGVADWRSLGLHYVATSDYAGDAPVSQATLARALECDSRNMPARIALRNLQDRDSTDRTDLGAYVDWLLSVANGPHFNDECPYALRLRVRMTLLQVGCNYIARFDEPLPDGVLAASEALMRDLKAHERNAMADGLVAGMKPSAAAAYLSIHVNQPAGPYVADARRWIAKVTDFTPKGHYNYACLLARDHVALRKDVAPDAIEHADFARASSHLRLASVDAELKAAHKTDPWLEPMLASDHYRKTFADKRRGSFEIEPLAGYRDVLGKIGLEDAAKLAHERPVEIADYLKVDRLIAMRLVRLAGLAALVPRSVAGWEGEILAALMKERIDSVEVLDHTLRHVDAGQLAERLCDTIRRRCWEEPVEEQQRDRQLGKWLRGRKYRLFPLALGTAATVAGVAAIAAAEDAKNHRRNGRWAVVRALLSKH